MKTMMLIGAGIVACAASGCGTSESVKPNDAVHQHRTVLDHGDGTKTDLGMQNWADSTKGFVKTMPLRSVQVSESGRVTAFTPAAQRHPDCPPVPVNTPLAYAKFNARGELIEWKLAGEDAEPVGVGGR